AAVFASLKKQAAHFFNSDFIGTEPTKAANPVAGVANQTVATLKCILLNSSVILYFRPFI
ncbi:MAG: hypothetical protein ABIQ31_13740, partial [Ferruginibacter sp.]